MTEHAALIADALDNVRQRINDAEVKYQRNADSVQLLAVSKTKPIADIQAAIDHGQYAFGENYVQEGVEKIQALPDTRCQWHFIGPLQSNKTRLVAEHFDWIHTVDRLKIATRLNEQRPEHLAPLNVCLQMNVSGEASKAGLSLDWAALSELAQAVHALPRLRLRGLMCIPEAQPDSIELRAQFAALRQQFAKLQCELPQLDTLSMGMSADLDAAVAEGSTLVRVGSAIFGTRAPKKPAN